MILLKTKKLLSSSVSLKGCSIQQNEDHKIRTLTVLKANNQINIPIDKSVNITLEGDNVKIFISEEYYNVCHNNKKKFLRSIVNTLSKIVNNAVTGLNEPFNVIMKIVGVGFKFEVEEQELILSIGYSFKLRKTVPSIIKPKVVGEKLHLASYNKEILMNFAKSLVYIKGRIDAYKGTGIFFDNQFIKLKEIKKK